MRTDRVLTRILSGAAGSVLALTLAACGDDAAPSAEESPDSASSSVTSAEPEESPSESAESEPAEEVGGGYDAEELLERMKAAIADNESAHVTMELTGGQQMSGEGDVSYAGEKTAMQMTLKMPQLGTGAMEMRMVDGVIYMAMPGLTPKGKFFEIDTNDPTSPFGNLGGVTQGDPLATFDAFDAGLQDATYVGEEDVDGEQLDHYVLTVDAAKAAKAQGQPVQPGMPETITYDMWIDGDDLMRRIEFDLGEVASGAGGMVMTMSDWGTPVTVEAPPRGAIMQMPGAPSQ